jgi:hypothetical protein
MKMIWGLVGVLATVMLTGSVAARDPYLTGAEVEKILVDGSVWGGAIDTRRPGCPLAQCAEAAGTFVFDAKSGGLKASVYFKAGKDGFDAHKNGQRFENDTTAGSEGPPVPVVIKSNGQVIFEARNKWVCRFQGDVGICYRQVRADGYRDKFRMTQLSN